jgi:hypothetical protein
MAHYSPVPQESVSAEIRQGQATMDGLVIRSQKAIAKSMQLITGGTAQQYNNRKQRRGAFWVDRYHASAVEAGGHLARCLVSIGLLTRP